MSADDLQPGLLKGQVFRTNTPPHCISYAKVPNSYGPYAYCSLDKAVDVRAQKAKFAW